MKTYNLTKTKNGEKSSTIQSSFYGDSLTDQTMLNEVVDYLKTWLDGYNNSLTDEKIDEILSNFDGSVSYDVYSFELIEAEDE